MCTLRSSVMGQAVKGIIRSTDEVLKQVLYHCSEGTAKTDVVKVAFLAVAVCQQAQLTIGVAAIQDGLLCISNTYPLR